MQQGNKTARKVERSGVMNKRLIFAMLVLATTLLPVAGGVQAVERFKPFVLASRGAGDFDAKVEQTRQALRDAGFEVLGEYTPYRDTFVDNARIIIATNDALKEAASKTKYGGFAAPWRIAVTRAGDEVQVAYANPAYIAHAYRLDSDLEGIAATLKDALGAMETFGSERGLSKRKLRKYHYTFGMEYFDDLYELAKYGSHKEAVASVEKNLEAGTAGVSKIYRLDLPGQVTLFGVARKAPSEDEQYMDEEFIMGIVDFQELKSTAYLPIEIMVHGNEVVALHMRFRMAVHYPDLKMMGDNSFFKLMPSPNAIRAALRAAAGASEERSSN
jgi:uncharacterized protein (DUF302 family)